jgi:hypothetical protein
MCSQGYRTGEVSRAIDSRKVVKRGLRRRAAKGREALRSISKRRAMLPIVAAS